MSAKDRPAVNLSDDEERLASSVLLFAQGDARTRVIVAGAFANPTAHQAGGTDWYGPLLVRLLEVERYPAVRYLAHRGLQSVYGDAAAGPFDFQVRRPERLMQLRPLREKYDRTAIPLNYPYLPLGPDGRLDDAVLRRLLERRTDPNLTINE